MTELTGKDQDRNPSEPLYSLGDKFHPFLLPQNPWYGYGGPFMVNPGRYSAMWLRTDDLPDLRFATVIQNDFPPRNELGGKWPIRAEADKRHLLKMGLIQRRGLGAGALGVTDITDIQLPHTFTQEGIEKVLRLRATMWVPEGEYVASPNPEELRNGELRFDLFKKVEDPSDERLWRMASKPDDKAYLDAIEVAFHMEPAKQGVLPRNPRFPAYDPNEALDAWVESESGGDPEKAEALRKRALETPVMRNFFLNPGSNTLVRSAPDFSIRHRLQVTRRDDTRTESKSAEEPKREPRNIDSLTPAEYDEYLSVPGWRVWSRSIFSRGKYREEFDRAAGKPLALICHERNRGYGTLFHWEADTQGKPRFPLFANGFDMPSFLLEPLTEEEVRLIDERGEAPGPLGSTDKPNELFRPDNLRKILDRIGR